MKNAKGLVIFALFFFAFSGRPAYPQEAPPAMRDMPKTVDLNNDRQPDVVYHHGGEHVSRAEADTNYDGKSDIVIETKDGKFVSAEVDSDYDGRPDKKFNDAKEFNQWLNENRPEFNEYLNRPDWEWKLFKF